MIDNVKTKIDKFDSYVKGLSVRDVQIDRDPDLLVHNIKKVYPNGFYEIREFPKGLTIRKSGWELGGSSNIPDMDDSGELIIDLDKQRLNKIRSIKRTKTVIKDYILSNDFKEFWTLTISPDKVQSRFDDDTIIKLFRKWINNIRSRKCKFHYICIPERHKNGALHFHLLVESHTLNLIDSGKKDKNGSIISNIKDWSYGYSTSIPLDANNERVANYVTKYISKHMDDEKAVKPRYIASRGLLKPEVVYNVDIDFNLVSPVFHSVNDDGEIKLSIYKPIVAT